MKKLTVLTFLITALFATGALAASSQQRLRGQIQSFNDHQLVLHTRSGQTKTVALNDQTAYAYVVKSSLSNVKKGDYIGTATTQKNGKLVALELVIFPNSMRGSGEGHYSWDKLPDTAQSGKKVSSSMTNGHVKSANAGSGNSQKLVSSSMTNGNVQSSQAQNGAKKITVSYKGGQKQILLPSSAPVVAFKKADHSALKKGGKVFVNAAKHNDHLTAQFVAVGKNGTKPPM